MVCDICKEGEKHRLRSVGNLAWACPDCVSKIPREESQRAFGVVPTVNFKYYYQNNGNVSKARVDMIKSRKLSPSGNGEVVQMSKYGKITDRPAYNY